MQKAINLYQKVKELYSQYKHIITTIRNHLQTRIWTKYPIIDIIPTVKKILNAHFTNANLETKTIVLTLIYLPLIENSDPLGAAGFILQQLRELFGDNVNVFDVYDIVLYVLLLNQLEKFE